MPILFIVIVNVVIIVNDTGNDDFIPGLVSIIFIVLSVDVIVILTLIYGLKPSHVD